MVRRPEPETPDWRKGRTRTAACCPFAVLRGWSAMGQGLRGIQRDTVSGGPGTGDYLHWGHQHSWFGLGWEAGEGRYAADRHRRCTFSRVLLQARLVKQGNGPGPVLHAIWRRLDAGLLKELGWPTHGGSDDRVPHGLAIWFGNQIEKRHRSNEWAVDMFGLCAAARKSGPGKWDAKYCFDPACVEDMAVSHHLQLLWSHLIYS